MDANGSYDVIIIGGGVTGTAILYVLSNYTNVARIALVEKYDQVAQVSSNPRNNSQTLHFGDIETNYSLEKALPVQEAGGMIKQYVTRRGDEGHLFRKSHKMVLAVGAAEVRQLEERWRTFRHAYPRLRRLERNEIAEVEPEVVEGRDPREPILALLSEDGYAVNYQRLSEAFLEDALASGKHIDLFFNTEVEDISGQDGFWTVRVPGKTLVARTVAVCAGPYSLLFAQKLGYGKEFAILPVAGSFYFSRKVLNGKVYTMQIEGIPFAAIHGDPDVVHPDETRFGPTANVLPLFERHKYGTFFDFLKTPILTPRGLYALCCIARRRTLLAFLLKNFLYDIPVIGKRLFLQDVRKIIPTIRYGELQFGKGLGGIRPQIVNVKTGELQMGESKIVGENIIFNTTPSPGASVCLKNAERDARQVVEFLGDGFQFDRESFAEDFGIAQTIRP